MLSRSALQGIGKGATGSLASILAGGVVFQAQAVQFIVSAITAIRGHVQ